jgi:hypothetical protein
MSICKFFAISYALASLACGGPSANEKALQDALDARKKADATTPRGPLTNAEHAENIKRAKKDANITPGKSALKVQLGMSLADVVAIHGEPDHPGPFSGDAHLAETRGWGAMSVNFVDGKVKDIFVDEKAARENFALTSEGVAWGAIKDHVIQSMGEPENTNYNGWYYPSRGISMQIDDRLRSFRIHAPTGGSNLAIEPGTGVGSAKLGAPCKEAADALGVPYFYRKSFTAGSSFDYWTGPAINLDVNLVCSTNGTVSAINLYPPFAGTTAEGVGLHSDLAMLKAKWGEPAENVYATEPDARGIRYDYDERDGLTVVRVVPMPK